MRLQATLNGPLSRQDHPAVPVSARELALDARACAAAGAESFHVHPRDGAGAERLDAATVDPVVAAVRAACRRPVGVSTGAWIEPDAGVRRRLVRAWTQPDFATVNLGEEGALDVAHALLDAGIGVEAGVWTVAGADLLVRSGLAPRVLRVCLEPAGVGAADALAEVAAIHAVLDEAGAAAPRLQHGDGAATWPVLADALRRGLATRVGFEDSLLLPDGTTAGSNADLVRAAVALAGRA